jgi:pimeloyl-ACP methyl ester carboxylesterase
MNAQSKYVMVDGVRTHYLEAGEGPYLILLHAGEFGGCSEISWEFNIESLAKHFHVLAPDFVGFGRSDKLRDFGGHGSRMLRHITRFLEVMCVDEADFIGNSISGRFLCRVASADHPIWPIRKMISVSGGGFEPDNEERRILQDYDASREGMQRVLQVLFYNSRWWDLDYLDRRHKLSLIPGAWEVAAASRFKSPAVAERPLFGKPDRIVYEQIRVPTLFVAGAEDRLLQPGYWSEVAKRTPKGDFVVFNECGHCPHIEYADEFNRAALDFLLAPHGNADRKTS